SGVSIRSSVKPLPPKRRESVWPILKLQERKECRRRPGQTHRSLKILPVRSCLPDFGRCRVETSRRGMAFPLEKPRSKFMPENSKPLIGVIKGSQSDWDTMQHAATQLD